MISQRKDLVRMQSLSLQLLSNYAVVITKARYLKDITMHFGQTVVNEPFAQEHNDL